MKKKSSLHHHAWHAHVDIFFFLRCICLFEVREKCWIIIITRDPMLTFLFWGWNATLRQEPGTDCDLFVWVSIFCEQNQRFFPLFWQVASKNNKRRRIPSFPILLSWFKGWVCSQENPTWEPICYAHSKVHSVVERSIFFQFQYHPFLFL